MGREKVAFKMTRTRASGDDEGGGRVRNYLSETSTADHHKKE